MKLRKPELLKTGFSADGNTAYCLVSIGVDSDDDEPNLSMGIDVRVELPISGTDTVDSIRTRGIQGALEMMRDALK